MRDKRANWEYEDTETPSFNAVGHFIAVIVTLNLVLKPGSKLSKDIGTYDYIRDYVKKFSKMESMV